MILCMSLLSVVTSLLILLSPHLIFFFFMMNLAKGFFLLLLLFLLFTFFKETTFSFIDFVIALFVSIYLFSNFLISSTKVRLCSFSTCFRCKFMLFVSDFSCFLKWDSIAMNLLLKNSLMHSIHFWSLQFYFPLSISIFYFLSEHVWVSVGAQTVESASSTGDLGSILGSGISPGEGKGNML